jgi:predicted metal-dependent phosphoesterase TrpH
LELQFLVKDNNMVVDLHTHSYYSDGIFSPAEVITQAKNAGCEIVALTDHDSTQGLAEARTVAQKYNMHFINGVEISATWKNRTIHINGLGFDENNENLQQLLQYHQELRQDRANKMAQSLEAAGITNAYENTAKLVQKSMITRTHFARMLIQQGVCKDMKSVFNRYLTNKKPGGIQTVWSSLEEVVEIIKKSGGKSVIAHPLRYRLTHTKIKQLFADFKHFGGDGVEVITGNSHTDDIHLVDKWSKEFNLAQSLGSDFHGDNNYIQVGKLSSFVLNNPIYIQLL